MYRTPCKYPGRNIAFHVNEGSTNYWLSLLVEFEGGDGDVGSMHIREVTILRFLHFISQYIKVDFPVRDPEIYFLVDLLFTIVKEAFPFF